MGQVGQEIATTKVLGAVRTRVVAAMLGVVQLGDLVSRTIEVAVRTSHKIRGPHEA